jgi:uncharacterized protein
MSGRRSRVLALAMLAVAPIGCASGLVNATFFHPARQYAPTELPDGVVETAVTTSDGVRLRLFVRRQPCATRCLVYFHGNAGNLSNRSSWLAWLRDRGYQAFCVDYRGYGKSNGAPSESGLYRDARAAYDHLIEHRGVKPGQILLMGRSLGCAVAIELAADGSRPVAAVALEAPFTSIGAMSRRVIPIIPVRWVLATRFDNLAKVPHLRQPLLLIHGAADELIPIAHGRALYAAAGGTPKQMFEVPGGLHNADNWLNDEYRRRLEHFVATHVQAAK